MVVDTAGGTPATRERWSVRRRPRMWRAIALGASLVGMAVTLMVGLIAAGGLLGSAGAYPADKKVDSHWLIAEPPCFPNRTAPERATAGPGVVVPVAPLLLTRWLAAGRRSARVRRAARCRPRRGPAGTPS